jgi:hypothetical protein
MALYSVWDWNRNAYRVYQTPGAASVGDDPKSPVPTGLHHLGADPDTQVNALPRNAKFLSYSHVARGEIRRMPGALGDVTSAPEDRPWWQSPVVMFSAGVGATVAYLTWGMSSRVRANTGRRRRRSRRSR